MGLSTMALSRLSSAVEKINTVKKTNTDPRQLQLDLPIGWTLLPPPRLSTTAAATLLRLAHTNPLRNPLSFPPPIMHFTSAALLLLLVPATRAAAIPNQGGLSALAGDVGETVRKADNTRHGTIYLPLNGHKVIQVGSAPAKRDEAANLVGSISDAPPVLPAAAGGVKQDDDADALANSIRKLTYEQIGALAKLLKVIGGRDSATASVARRDITDQIPGLLLDLAGIDSATASAIGAGTNIAGRGNRLGSGDIGGSVSDATGDVSDLVDNAISETVHVGTSAPGSIGNALDETPGSGEEIPIAKLS
ncbi:hypothetical protein V495_03984 [Pseudogymnoascus sp. VKM F-4514 (FW-929)]|nr:hypothetical protein V495_03984 [Pseudogymnoascus sp. VKM F-4514 (FW-929)]KFY56646.1 hypothetical protein V497_06063 [Pseudogymnoascus sp. VKM F-4516 (FW-969)]